MISPELAAALRAVMRVERVLVACDFDGTLAPLVDDPAGASPLASSSSSLHRLAAMAGISVAIVSGRARADLLERTGFHAPIHIVGSHGAEFERDRLALPDDRQRLLDRVATALDEVAAGTEGARVERKPVGAVLHYRTVESRLVGDLVGRAVEAIEALGDDAGLRILSGSSVLEVVVVREHKGWAVDRLRALCAVDAVVFVGDDRTDEDAFEVLVGADVGVKVGVGPTVAAHRVDDVDGVCEVLELVVLERSRGSVLAPMGTT